MENNYKKNEGEKPTKKKDGLLDFIKYIVFAIIIVIPIRMFIAQPFVVSGESMFPTFQDKEYLIVDEISYLLGKPHRGDVIVFHYPLDTKRFFIKRIIGMPNEQIDIKGGIVTIFNKENPEGFIYDEPFLKQSFLDTTSFKTGDKEYYVLGDNRSHSSDSRVWGPLPEKLIMGEAFLRLFPLKEISYLPGNYKVTK